MVASMSVLYHRIYAVEEAGVDTSSFRPRPHGVSHTIVYMNCPRGLGIPRVESPHNMVQIADIHRSLKRKNLVTNILLNSREPEGSPD